jgi:hypothetical protein
MNTCKHQGCSCKVQDRQPYCSKHCSEASQGSAGRSSGCACGHPECGHK